MLFYFLYLYQLKISWWGELDKYLFIVFIKLYYVLKLFICICIVSVIISQLFFGFHFFFFFLIIRRLRLYFGITNTCLAFFASSIRTSAETTLRNSQGCHFSAFWQISTFLVFSQNHQKTENFIHRSRNKITYFNKRLHKKCCKFHKLATK